MHIAFCSNKRMVGTLRYASINSQLGYELSRRDDLESLGYCIIYMLKGRLPWQGVVAEAKMEKHSKVLIKKQDIPVSELCRGLPVEVSRYMYYCRNLGFEDAPVYSQLYKLFNKVLEKTQRHHTFEFDWDAMKCDLTTRTYRDENDSNKAECEDPLKPSKLNMSRRIEIMNLTSGIYLEASKEPCREALLNSSSQQLPEEEKAETSPYDISKTPVISRSFALFLRKQGRGKISSQGSQEKMLRASYRYFNAVGGGVEEDALYNFQACEITERIYAPAGSFGRSCR